MSLGITKLANYWEDIVDVELKELLLERFYLILARNVLTIINWSILDFLAHSFKDIKPFLNQVILFVSDVIEHF